MRRLDPLLIISYQTSNLMTLKTNPNYVFPQIVFVGDLDAFINTQLAV